MAINIFKVIQGPVISEKAMRLMRDLKKIVLKVHPQANKPMVAEALQKLFDVKVKDVRIVVRKGKVRKSKRKEVRSALTKRAIVTLKDAQSFDILAQASGGSIMTEQSLATADVTKE